MLTLNASKGRCLQSPSQTLIAAWETAMRPVPLMGRSQKNSQLRGTIRALKICESTTSPSAPSHARRSVVKDQIGC